MPTLDEVKRQINAFPHRYIFWTQKEIRALPEILDRDEVVKAATSGLMDSATWLAICTNRRLIFLNRGMLYGLRQVQFPLDRIQSIDHAFTIFFGSIRVWDGASAFTINMVLKSSILPFVRITEEAMYALRKTQSPSAQSTHAPATDTATQLAKLVELKEKGYLTDAEFQAQKKKLLG
jgi:hypothetical protein